MKIQKIPKYPIKRVPYERERFSDATHRFLGILYTQKIAKNGKKKAKKGSPRRGIEPRSTMYCLTTNGDSSH